jgi:hypothetical protein
MIHEDKNAYTIRACVGTDYGNVAIAFFESATEANLYAEWLSTKTREVVVITDDATPSYGNVFRDGHRIGHQANGKWVGI